jgi:DDE superfamily endonuclease
LAFKVLLLLDNAPGHPVNIKHPNVEIVFMPPNTTSLIQPMDQGLIATFKAYYIRRTFERIHNQLEADPSMTVQSAWKQFNILNCVQIVAECVEELQPKTLNGCWKPIWPKVVEHPVPQINPEVQRIVDAASRINAENFTKITTRDVEELLADPEISEEDAIEIATKTDNLENLENQSCDEDEAENQSSVLSTKDLKEMCELAAKLESYAEKENSEQVQRLAQQIRIHSYSSVTRTRSKRSKSKQNNL